MSVSANKLHMMVDDLFEGLLKKVFRGPYPLQPIFVERAVEKAIVENTKVFKSGVLPPNRIEILMSREDYADFKKIEGVYRRQIEESAQSFIENEFREQTLGKTKPVITIKSDPDVPQGAVRVKADHHEESYGGLK
ncbi:MAG: FhaA domain-containing protein [Nitrospirota bacterium]